MKLEEVTGKTQEQIASGFGKQASWLCRILNGTNPPYADDLNRLCSLAGVDYADYQDCANPRGGKSRQAVEPSMQSDGSYCVNQRLFELELEFLEETYGAEGGPIRRTIVSPDGTHTIIPFATTLISKRSHIVLRNWAATRSFVFENATNHPHIKALRETNPGLFNGVTFCARGITSPSGQSQSSLVGGLSDYFSMLIEHNSIEEELKNEVRSQLYEPIFRADLINTPQREKFHAKQTDDHFYSALGITTLVCYKDVSGDRKLIVRKRSGQVATHSGLINPVPSGMFQPHTSSHVLEWDIQHQVIKEFCEEVFGRSFDYKKTFPGYIYLEHRTIS